MTKKVVANKKPEIVLHTDESTEMQFMTVTVNGKTHELYYGNTWDYHCGERFAAVCEVLKLLKVEFNSKTKDFVYEN